MNHGLTNSALYCACKVISSFEDSSGKRIEFRGTGFFTNNKAGVICLVTNRHIVEADYKQDTSKYKDFNLVRFVVENHTTNPATGLPDIITEIDVGNFKDFLYSSNIDNDIACLMNIESLNGNHEIGFFIPYNWIADQTWINTKLHVCDFVAFPGFPEWYDKLNNNPIIRSGTIASDPRYNYSNSHTTNGECIAYEAFSFDGSSGSPVFALQKGFLVSGGIQASEDFYHPVRLIGINAGHLNGGYSHSGISYLYKSSAILDIIDR